MCGVCLRGDVEVRVDDRQLGSVFEGVDVEAELEEEAAQRPNVTRRADGIVAPAVDLKETQKNIHFSLTSNLLLSQS